MFLNNNVMECILGKRLSGMDKYQLAGFAITMSFVFSLCIVVMKVSAYFVTNSISMQASAIDAVLDSFSSLIALLAVKFSAKEVSEKYLFGRGKIESLAGLLQGGFIGHTAVMMYTKAYEVSFGIVVAEPIEHSEIGIAVLIAASVLVYILVSAQQYVMSNVDSTNVKGEIIHYKSDLLMNMAIMLSLIFKDILPSYFDMLFGIGIATYMLYNTIGIVKTSVADLLDVSLKEDVVSKMKEIISAAPHYVNLQKLMTRSSGMAKQFVIAEVCVKSGLSHAEAETTRRYIEENITKEYPLAEVIAVIVSA